MLVYFFRYGGAYLFWSFTVWYILSFIQLSGIYWWYKTASHAAELTAGYYNPCNRDGYAAIMTMLKINGVGLNIPCVELHTLNQHEGFPETFADPEGLVWQVSVLSLPNFILLSD